MTKTLYVGDDGREFDLNEFAGTAIAYRRNFRLVNGERITGWMAFASGVQVGAVCETRAGADRERRSFRAAERAALADV